MIARKARTIAVVSGDFLLGRRITNILGDMGHRAALASTGKDAITAIDRRVDLVLIDLTHGAGAEFVLEYILQMPPQTRPLTIAVGAPEDSDMVENIGVTDFIERDRVNPEALAYKVNRALFSGEEPVDSRKRVPVSITTVFTVDGKSGTGILMNLSHGGAFLHTDQALRDKAHIELTFYLENELITARGVVKWTAPGARENLFCGSGIAFTALPWESLRRLSEFVRARLEENGVKRRRAG